LTTLPSFISRQGITFTIFLFTSLPLPNEVQYNQLKEIDQFSLT